MEYYKMFFDQAGIQNIEHIGQLTDEEYDKANDALNNACNCIGEFVWLVDEDEMQIMRKND